MTEDLKDTFYITSAIYYVNAEPHVGHTYEIVACDVIARYHRLRGEPVFFLTGTDEHSQNVAKAAADEGVSPQAWADRMVPKWREVFRRLDISNDDFIRTSEQRHVERVQQFVKLLYDKGDVYRGTYEGPYCVSCEEFKQEGELVEGKCPIHLIPVEWTSEENYFFRLSAYGDALLELYERHPEFVYPDFRRNEVVSFVGGGLEDLSISRNQSLWGVPVPWDPQHVIYVWVDALLNYITAPGFGSAEGLFDRVWPADIHMIGKDIIRFHAVIWPAMLMSAGVPVPRQVATHGFITMGGEKMSKSRGTGIHPFEVLDRCGPDPLRYYFLREISFGQDGSFTWDSLRSRYNAELANGLGNLASRVLAMTGSYFDGLVPAPPERSGGGRLQEGGERLAKAFDEHMLALELTDAAAALDGFVREANRYLVEVAPWNLAKDEQRRAELADVLYASLEALRLIALLAFPIMPAAAARLWEQLGLQGSPGSQRLPDGARWGGLEPGTRTRRGESLFPRMEG